MTRQTWKWLVAALAIYGADLGLRLIRRRRNSDVISTRVYEKSNVIEVQLALSETSLTTDVCVDNVATNSDSRRNSTTPSLATFWSLPPSLTPGHYVYLKCPEISLVEWHPFSLSVRLITV